MTAVRLSGEGRNLFSEDSADLLAWYGAEGMGYPLASSTERLAYAESGLTREDLARLRVRRLEGVWRLPDALRARTEGALATWRRHFDTATVFDGSNVRWTTLDGAASPLLSTQQTVYEDYIRSNLVLDHYEDGASVREFVHPGGRLDDLSQSALANTIGINILMVGAAGDIPLQVRSATVAVRPHQVCSSASGALEAADIPLAAADLATCHLLREAEEEIGSGFVGAHLGKPVVLGLWRELARGGHPELFVAVEGDFTRAQALSAFAEAGSEAAALDFVRFPKTGDRFDRAGALAALEDLERRFPGRLATPLKANLALLLDYLAGAGRMT